MSPMQLSAYSIEFEDRLPSKAEVPLAGRAALITGANRGLGYEIARAYLRAGCDVFLCARNGSLLRPAADPPRGERGDGAIVLAPADIAREDDVDRVVREALGCFPHLDILVNNAGVYGPMGTLE